MDPFQLAARFRPLFRSGDRIVLGSDNEVRIVDHPVGADVIEALYRGSNFVDLERALHGSHAPADIAAAIDQLQADGLLSVPNSRGPAEAAYWDSIGCAPPHGEMGFRALCPQGAELIARALSVNGLTVSDSAKFTLVTTDDYLLPELAELNRGELAERTWMLAKPAGHTIWIGPVFIPGETACWECLAAWLKPHRWQQAAFSGWEGNSYPPQTSFASLQTTIGLAAGIIATTASVWAAQDRYPSPENAILTLDTRTLRSSLNKVHPRPDCARCHAVTRPSPARWRDFVSPLTGIVSDLETTSEPVFAHFHARARFVSPLPKGSATRDFPWYQCSAGKGPTREIAETICVAEALERYSLVHQGNEPTVRARISEIAGLSPEEVLLFSDAQYLSRDQWNPRHGNFQWIPERFDPSESIEWSEARSLAGDRRRYIPTALCYMYYGFGTGRRFCSPDTNGCAAGRSLTEAKLAGLLELIERDAVAIWWYNRLRRPAVELAAFEDPQISELVQAFRERGRSVHLLDITNDTSVPAYAAITPFFDGSSPVFAAAASLSPRQAAYKAIAEAAQICVWNPDDDRPGDLLTWLRTENMNRAVFLDPVGFVLPAAEPKAEAAIALNTCVRHIQSLGIEPYYIDLTRPEIGVPVVRVIAPGLRHFWARFAAGRIYSVPLRMKWLDRSLDESELNPIPCMI